MDELISDEAAQDIQINYGIWKLEKNKEQKKITRISKEDIEFYTDCRCG